MAHQHTEHDDGHHHGRTGHHGHAHAHGASDKGRVLLVAALTGLFMAAEAIGGYLTGSLALLADAGHMLADSVALWLAWFAFRLSERPATSRLTYGFSRIKMLVAYTNGLTIFAVAGWIVYEAWHRIQDPAPILGGPMLGVAIAGLAINVAGFFILHGGDRENLNMRGALLHVLGDMLGSLAAIVAALVIVWTGWTPIDPILSVLVAVIILSTAWRLMRDAAHVLLEGTPEGLDRDTLARDLVGHVQGVRDVHHVHVWSLDGAGRIATLHARLDPGRDVPMAIAALKRRLSGAHGITHATIEPEFGVCADQRSEATLHSR